MTGLRITTIVRIFNIMSWFIAVMGGTCAFFIFLAGFGTAGSPMFNGGLAIIIALNTVITWAALSLAAIVAQYMSYRMRKADTTHWEPLASVKTQPPQQEPRWRDEPQWMKNQ